MSTLRALPARGALLRRLGEPVGLVSIAILLCWATAVGLLVAGGSDLISHDAIIEEGHLPPAVAIAAFLLIWQLMTGAMMLPSIVPVVGIFGRLAGNQQRPRRAIGLFIGAYFAVWTAFALAALAGDTGIHWLVDHWGWLEEREWLITAGLLVGAGIFQLTPLKERCLTECRNPLQFVWRRYQPGLRGAWRLGVAHALFCVGCCWALMLVMFALGVGSLSLMALLTGVMVIEKTWRGGARFVPVVSVVLIGLGAITVLVPAAMAAIPPLP